MRRFNSLTSLLVQLVYSDPNRWPVEWPRAMPKEIDSFVETRPDRSIFVLLHRDPPSASLAEVLAKRNQIECSE